MVADNVERGTESEVQRTHRFAAESVEAAAESECPEKGTNHRKCFQKCFQTSLVLTDS